MDDGMVASLSVNYTLLVCVHSVLRASWQSNILEVQDFLLFELNGEGYETKMLIDVV